MQQFFVIASSEDGDDLSLLVQAEDVHQVLPLWANHFEQDNVDHVSRIYLLPLVGPHIKAVAWKDMQFVDVNAKH